MKTMQERIKENNIKISSEYVDSNPHMNDPKWEANHYRVTLRFNRKQLTCYFSMGIGLSGEPTAEDVLNSLAADAAGVENARDFEDWCSEYGYDTDSRKAEKTFKICQKQAKQLKAFLGDDLYQAFLFDTEAM
jgi:hypothetical protein